MDAVGAVVADWKSNEKLVLFAAGGIMAKVGNGSDLDRDELDSNKDVLSPIIRHLGFLASINFAQASVMSWMLVVPGFTFNRLYPCQELQVSPWKPRLETIYRLAVRSCGSFSTSLSAPGKKTSHTSLGTKPIRSMNYVLATGM